MKSVDLARESSEKIFITIFKIMCNSLILFLQMMRKILVPAESVPSLLGLNGSKHQDTQKRTGSEIVVNRVQEDPLAEVKIKGGDELLAEALLILAVKHYFASQEPLPMEREETNEEDIVFYDLKCFITETISISS